MISSELDFFWPLEPVIMLYIWPVASGEVPKGFLREAQGTGEQASSGFDGNIALCSSGVFKAGVCEAGARGKQLICC